MQMSDSRPGRFNPEEKASSIHRTEEWIASTSLDAARNTASIPAYSLDVQPVTQSQYWLIHHEQYQSVTRLFTEFEGSMHTEA